MSVKTSLGALAAFVLAAVATAANAQVPSCVAIDGIERVTITVDNEQRCFYKFDDRFYEVLVDAGISWDEARDKAAARKGPNFFVGSLATISGPAEDEALFKMAKANKPPGSRTHAWIHGEQKACTDPEVPAVKCGWVMGNGQQIPPENNPGPLSFAAWLLDQPDDDDGNEDGEENFLAIGKEQGWTDEGPGNVFGWIQEFGDDVPYDLTACVGAFCNPTGLLDTKFPLNTVIVQDGIVGDGVGTQTVYRITDPRVNPATGACDQAIPGAAEPLTLKLDLDSSHAGIDVTVPPHLCAYVPANAPTDTPAEFILIRVKAPGVVIENGLIDLVTDAETVLPGTQYGCNPPHVADPLKEDLVTHQRSDVDDDILKDVTHGCINPPRGGTYRPSWFGLGFAFNTGTDSADPLVVRNFLIERQRLNLQALLDIIVLARQQRLASDPVSKSFESKVRTALNKLLSGAFQNSLDSLRQADKLNIQAAFQPTTDNKGGQCAGSLRNAIDLYQRRWFTVLQ
jgi:hypothetical protein